MAIYRLLMRLWAWRWREPEEARVILLWDPVKVLAVNALFMLPEDFEGSYVDALTLFFEDQQGRVMVPMNREIDNEGNARLPEKDQRLPVMVDPETVRLFVAGDLGGSSSRDSVYSGRNGVSG